MRKTIVIVAMFLMVPILGISQTDQGAGAGSVAVELSMTPFTESEAWLSPGFLKARYFLNDLGIRLSTGTDMIFSNDQGVQPESVKNLSFFDVRPGVEYYPVGAGQALPFVGIDFVMQFQRSSFDTSVGAPVTGAWDIDPHMLEKRSFNAFGFNIFAGGDYYLGGGGFFIGTEIGFEFLHKTHLEVKLGDDVRFPETTKAIFYPTLRSSLRVGVAF